MYRLIHEPLRQTYNLLNTDTNQSMELQGLGDLSEIYHLIQNELENAQLLRMLTVQEMITIARQEGAAQIRTQTITNACNRGGMPNAVKRDGRWTAPEPAFREWLRRYINRLRTGDKRFKHQ